MRITQGHFNCLCCHVRTLIPRDVQEHDGWEHLKDGPIEALPGAVEIVSKDDEADGDSGEAARVPRGLPEPTEPSAEERARHNLNHWPYKCWCEHCVRARRPNSPHVYSPSSSSRSIPVFVANYCFLRDAQGESLVTCFVGKTYPSRNTIALIVD